MPYKGWNPLNLKLDHHLSGFFMPVVWTATTDIKTDTVLIPEHENVVQKQCVHAAAVALDSLVKEGCEFPGRWSEEWGIASEEEDFLRKSCVWSWGKAINKTLLCGAPSVSYASWKFFTHLIILPNSGLQGAVLISHLCALNAWRHRADSSRRETRGGPKCGILLGGKKGKINTVCIRIM